MYSSKIRVLSEQIINQIAAGEVIENPSSVVKELVENALDAGSTEISIEIMGGGRQLIRISDNGWGMNRDDALLCLERHATSKIRSLEDIYSIHTMGFRGEALASIASISKMTLLTSPRDSQEKESATLVSMDGGKLMGCHGAVRDPGTTIEVKSLFFNVPVRKKFQRSPHYDAQEIQKMVSTLALGYPEIKFRFLVDQKLFLATSVGEQPFKDQLKKRMEEVLGEEFASMLPLENQLEECRIQGFVGFPTSTRNNRTGQYLFINRRAVISPRIAFAVREGYGTALPENRHPLFLLHLDMPGELLDVNVHPQKKEVRFSKESLLKELVQQGVKKALGGYSFSFSGEKSPFEFPKAPLFSLEQSVEPYLFGELPPFKMSVREESFSTPLPFSPPPLEDESPSLPLVFEKKEAVRVPKVLLTIPGFFILDAFPPLQLEEGLILVDQTACHARVVFDQLTFHKEKISIQPLLIPHSFEASGMKGMMIRELIPVLSQMGIEIREFGEGTFLIDALPEIFGNVDLSSFILEIVENIKEFQDERGLERKREKTLATMAVRSSVSKGKKLSVEEAQRMIQELMKSESLLYCPKGKPIVLQISHEELTKRFIRH